MDEIDWEQLRIRSRGRLPHWEIPGMTVFLTFRQADSLPKSVLDAYLAERKRIEKQLAADPKNPDLLRQRARAFGHHIDRALDQGMGSCAMRDPRFAARVMAGIRNRDGLDYYLHAAAVMPNHVHAVVTLHPEIEMAFVTHGWKSPTAHLAVGEFGHTRPFWQKESYDHIVRHEKELRAVKRYVVNNPKKANLTNWPWIYEREESE